MHQLTGRLTALDPAAAEVIRVIGYFDELVAHRGGLESIVRGAAILSGVPARLVTDSRRVPLRVLADGRRHEPTCPADDRWESTSLPDVNVTLWLERVQPPSDIDAMILERAMLAIRSVLDRTPFRAYHPAAEDLALVEIVVDPEANAETRAHAARRLGIRPGQLIRAVASPNQPTRLELADSGCMKPAMPVEGRAGLGPVVPVENAPDSARAASTALRFTTRAKPTNVVSADELGALMLLADVVDDGTVNGHPDITALNVVIHHGPPWLLETLNAIASTDSVRSAAITLVIHHSTLQKRLTHAIKALGWDITTPAGKLRLQVALIVHRLTES